MSSSLFPEIDEFVAKRRAAFKSYIDCLKNEHSISCRVSELYEFEVGYCSDCDKRDGCNILSFIAAVGCHEDVIEVNGEVLCLSKREELLRLEKEFYEHW